MPAAHTERIFGGIADRSRDCSYFVTDVSGAEGNSFGVWFGDQEPTIAMESPSADSEPLVWSGSASDCASSYGAYDIFGYVPEHILVGSGGQITLVPGEWTTIKSATVTGYFDTEASQCRLDFGAVYAYQGTDEYSDF